MKKLFSLLCILALFAFTSCSNDSDVSQDNPLQEEVSLNKSKPGAKPPLFIFEDNNEYTLLYFKFDGTLAPVPVSQGWIPCPGGGSNSGGIASMRYWNTSGQFLMVERSFSRLDESAVTSVGSTYGVLGELFWRTTWVSGC